MRRRPTSPVLALAVLCPLVGCSSAAPDDPALEASARVTVCVGTTATRAAGDTAKLRITSQDDVLAVGELTVPGELVLTIPASAREPRLLVDGTQWASSPRGGGRGVGQGDGCPGS